MIYGRNERMFLSPRSGEVPARPESPLLQGEGEGTVTSLLLGGGVLLLLGWGVLLLLGCWLHSLRVPFPWLLLHPSQTQGTQACLAKARKSGRTRRAQPCNVVVLQYTYYGQV